jgi:ABC-2 type transport system permease protein
VSSLRTFAAIAYNEALLNSKRVAPYVLMVLFAGNALLWWAKGPAGALGWATNSDFYISRSLKAFSFLLGLPLFNAVIMGDPVIRDFRLGVDPLIFSKPISRAQYLFGKFFGNFFVLLCCMAAFPLTQFVLQAFRPSRMVVQAVQVLPYFKHFFFFVVITHLTLAAFYFAVGALTRNSKIVYGLAIGFYPIYISWMLFVVSPLSDRWKTFFDPFLLNSGPSKNGFGNSAEFLNSYVMSYTPDMIANRALVISVAAICLTVLYLRFTITERTGNQASVLGLATASDRVFFDASMFDEPHAQFEKPALKEKASLPSVTRATNGFRSSLEQLIAATGVEFRLLLAERSLLVMVPLVVVLSLLEVAFYNLPPDVSHSAAYATNTAKLLLLFLVGIAVFYTGEAVHRDREVQIEPVIWSTPVTNSVLLLSKFLATVVLTFSLLAAVGLLAIMIQLLRGHTPVDVSAYLMVYGVVVVPGVIFVTALVVALNALLRNKYLAYVMAVGTGAGLFYLYSVGYNHWLYNPLLYQLWQYPDLATARILSYRLYYLLLAAVCLALAHLLFERRST